MKLLVTGLQQQQQFHTNHVWTDIAQAEKNAAFVATNVCYLWASKTSRPSSDHNEIIVVRFIVSIE